jgi:hypothetical protein
VDYLLFCDGNPVGVIEAKVAGTTLTEVGHQSGKYVEGLPSWMNKPVYPLPFIYESTGAETRFTNGYDPEARSRAVFTFHRSETLAEWARRITDDRRRWQGSPSGWAFNAQQAGPDHFFHIGSAQVVDAAFHHGEGETGEDDLLAGDVHARWPAPE